VLYQDYVSLTQPLLGKKIKKSSRVFNDKKVTDHHAIIPTGIQTKLQYNQQQVYDIIVKRFIAVFYDDCKVSNTTVIGKADDVTFKTTGKEILEKGWRVVFDTSPSLGAGSNEGSASIKKEEKGILHTFEKGEKGSHKHSFL